MASLYYWVKTILSSIVRVRSKTIFTTSSPDVSGVRAKVTDGSKISYWLERLYRQGELRNKKQSIVAARRRDVSEGTDLPPDEANEITQSGINENTKNIAIKNEEDMQTVNDLVKISNRSIISISSLFPWDIFPNTIDVQESRVTFKFRQFLTSQTHSVDIKDISNVFISSSLFFASLQIVSRTYVENEIKIGNLSKTKAKKVQKIIEGLRTFAEHDINTSNYEVEELIAKIEEFQTSAEAE